MRAQQRPRPIRVVQQGADELVVQLPGLGHQAPSYGPAPCSRKHVPGAVHRRHRRRRLRCIGHCDSRAGHLTFGPSVRGTPVGHTAQQREPSRMAQRQRRGFSLLEIAIALTIIGLLTAGAAQMLTTLTVRSQEQKTKQRIEEIKAALVQHFARKCRLPCPALADIKPSHSEAGKEQDGGSPCTTGDNVSAVPWKALGIQRGKTFDSWNRRFRYRPSKELAEASPVPFSPCNSDGGPAFSTWLTGKGLTVRDKNGTAFQKPAAGTGAAFLVLSHGPNGLGAYFGDSPPIDDSGADPDERENSDDDTIFVDRARTTQNAKKVFDDVVTSVRIQGLARKAGMYPVTPSSTSGGSGSCPGGGSPPCGAGGGVGPD